MKPGPAPVRFADAWPSWARGRWVDAEIGAHQRLDLAAFRIVQEVGAIAGVLAGLRPARRAAKLPVLQAVASE